MKVALIVPPSPNIESNFKTLPLGLAYIAAVLEKSGHNVLVKDLGVDGQKTLIPFLLKERPGVVGVTATTASVEKAWEVLKITKEHLDAITVIGGTHASAMPEESASKDFVDIVVRNEGEMTMLNICDNLENGKGIDNGISGITFKQSDKIINTPAREMIQDLDSLPFPARHLFPSLEKYDFLQNHMPSKKPYATMLTSRGCPFHCIFCFKGVFGSKFRARSVENIIAEWELLLYKFGIKEITICDDNFAYDFDRVSKFCDQIISKKLVIPWELSGGIRPDLIERDRFGDLLAHMKRAGCCRVTIGVESGSDIILKKMAKQTNVQMTKKLFKALNKVKIKSIASFMLGNYGEDAKTMQETIDLSKEINASYANFIITTPFPGTPLYRLVEKRGRLLVNNWSEYEMLGDHAFFEMGEVTKDLVEKMQKKAFKEFYFRPKYILSNILEIRSFAQCQKLISSGSELIRRYIFILTNHQGHKK